MSKLLATIRRWGTVRNSLYITSGVTTALLVMLTVQFWLDSYKVQDEVQ
jgi:hypothetical protein